MGFSGLFKRFIDWRTEHISDRVFILIISVVVGLAVGLAAVTIKNLVHVIQHTLSKFIHGSNFIYIIILPSIGILLTILFIKYVNRKPVGHGIPGVLFSISRLKGRIKRHNLFSSIVSSALTVGFGGSVGLEGPTVATGAAIGSNIGHALKLNYKQVTLLLGCACAGAMSSIFKAPIAAIVFALEVIMLDLTMAAIVPLLISSATAALTSYLFMGRNFLYSFEIIETFQLNQIPFYIVFGIFTGVVSAYFTKTYQGISEIFEKIKSEFTRFLLGGFLLGLLIFIFPILYGEGYEAINSSLSGDWTYLFENTFYKSDYNKGLMVIVLLLFVMLFKAVATALTFGAGGVGEYLLQVCLSEQIPGYYLLWHATPLGLIYRPVILPWLEWQG